MGKKTLLLMFLILLVGAGCSLVTEVPSGSIKVGIDLSKPRSLGYSINKITLELKHEKSGETIEREFSIVNTSANFQIRGLRVGQWQIKVKLYEDTQEVGAGMTTVSIEKDAIASASITITLYTGSLNLDVDWENQGDPPEGFTLVNPSTFTMGRTKWSGQYGIAYDNELPTHLVELTKPYIIAKYEVSYAKWKEVYDWAIVHGYDFSNAGWKGGQSFLETQSPLTDDTHPVTHINWYDAVKWCNAYSEMTNKPLVYFVDTARSIPYRTGQVNLVAENIAWEAKGYRLLTEAEWENAAKGGASTHNYEFAGGDSYADYGWVCYNADDISHSVGLKLPNELDLYDMTGNAREWCWDGYGLYSTDSLVDPKGNDSSQERLTKGGSYHSWDFGTAGRVASRAPLAADALAKEIGFRIGATF